MRIILGSQSPRRKEILSYFSLPFEQISPDADERIDEAVPDVAAEKLARKKAEAFSHYGDDTIVITADTIVAIENKLLGKPSDEGEAAAMLEQLSGKWHVVVTGVAVKKGDKLYSGTSKTDVLFHSVSAEQIAAYLRQLHCGDKAGGYAIQGAGGIIVKEIRGCYANVMGLPIALLTNLLSKVGIDLWNFLKA